MRHMDVKGVTTAATPGAWGEGWTVNRLSFEEKKNAFHQQPKASSQADKKKQRAASVEWL